MIKLKFKRLCVILRLKLQGIFRRKSQSLGRFDKTVFPMLADSIVEVQPMPGPISQVFHMTFSSSDSRFIGKSSRVKVRYKSGRIIPTDRADLYKSGRIIPTGVADLYKSKLRHPTWSNKIAQDISGFTS